MLPRGKGRGDLMKRILEKETAASQSSEEHKSQSDASTSDKNVSSVLDSGVESLTQSSQLQQLPSQSQTRSSSGSGIGGSGRGRLFQSIQSQSQPSTSTPSTSSSSHGETPPVKLTELPSSGKGRGKLREYLASSHSVQPQPHIEDITQKTSEIKIGGSESEYPEYEVKSEQEPEPVIRRGEFGEPVNVVVNYLRLKSDPNKGVFEYEVRFSPNVDSRNQRIKYLNEHRNEFGGTKTFDGVTLYLPILLKDKITKYYSKNPVDNSTVEIKIMYKRKKSLRECIHLYNVLFDRVMKTLNYVRSDRKQFDPTAPKIIPQHKLEIWPGYVTAVDEYEDGVMLCCDVSHRVLCQLTVLEKIREIYMSNRQNFEEMAKKALVGSVVLTRYNNKTYRIDDIDFEKSPLSTFKMTDGSEMTYMQYYQVQYNISITDEKQPLLVSRKERRVAGKDKPEELLLCILPEISYLTGLRDEMRADYKVMKDIATYTKVTPNQRIAALEKFYQNINKSQAAREILSDWGLEICPTPDKLSGRQFPEENIYFARKHVSAGVGASFGRDAGCNQLLEVVNIHSWILIHTRNTSNAAKSFLDFIQMTTKPMGIQINRPFIQVLNDDRTDSYINTLRQIVKKETQIVVIICPTARDDRYSAIKKLLCSEIPIPSQVINGRTLSNESKNRSIVQKIVLQMNCKLGGTLWSVRIPTQNLMICGIDSYHDAGQRGNSVAAFVASINSAYTKWYSKAIIQTKKEEIVNGLCVSLKFALQSYEKMNNNLPDRIMIFRDGVSDGELKLCSEYELPQFEEACRMHRPNYNPKFTYVVVQKRINTRIFAETGRNEYKNPNPGFVLDHTVTRKFLYDFFLVSQSVREGTVSPTHYVVVADKAGFTPDIIQRISYKLCYMYYNFPGTVRVPACCQYAHKLAYLVGQNVKRNTSESLADKLFYL